MLSQLNNEMNKQYDEELYNFTWWYFQIVTTILCPMAYFYTL